MTKFINTHSFKIQALCAVCFGFTVTMFGWKSFILFVTFMKWASEKM